MKRIFTVLAIGLSVVIGLFLTSETYKASQQCNSYKILTDADGTYLEDINSLDPISDVDKIICIVGSYSTKAQKNEAYAKLSRAAV